MSMLAAGVLEYRYLSDLTGDSRFADRSAAVRAFLEAANKPQGLYPEEVDIESGRWKSPISSLFFSGKCLYINFLAAFRQSGGKDEDSFRKYVAGKFAGGECWLYRKFSKKMFDLFGRISSSKLQFNDSKIIKKNLHTFSAQRGARTHDPEIKSLMLYRLS